MTKNKNKKIARKLPLAERMELESRFKDFEPLMVMIAKKQPLTYVFADIDTVNIDEKKNLIITFAMLKFIKHFTKFSVY
jgi:hypothetical protein